MYPPRVDSTEFSSLARSILILIIFAFGFVNESHAKFSSNYSCTNQSETCSQPAGWRVVDNVSVYRDCWEKSYNKICNVPSLNNCNALINEGCVFFAGKETDTKCKEDDVDGSCLNQQREYGCYRTMEMDEEKEEIVIDPDDQENSKRMRCKGIKCLDGSCTDNKVEPNGEFGQAMSMLKTAAEMSEGVSGDLRNSLKLENIKIDIFKGSQEHCNSKLTGYRNCCVDKGWGKQLNAKCSSSQLKLIEKRNKNLCLPAGEECKKEFLGKCVVKKFYYCCYDNLLAKAIASTRSDSFRQHGHNCRGFTLSEIKAIDFSKLDLREFEQDILQKAEKAFADSAKDLQTKIQANMPQISSKKDKYDQTAGSDVRVLEMNASQNGSSEHSYDSSRPGKWREKIEGR